MFCKMFASIKFEVIFYVDPQLISYCVSPLIMQQTVELLLYDFLSLDPLSMLKGVNID